MNMNRISATEPENKKGDQNNEKIHLPASYLLLCSRM